MVARCHARLWPLSGQSHRRAGEAKVKRTATGAAQYVVFRRNLTLRIFKYSSTCESYLCESAALTPCFRPLLERPCPYSRHPAPPP